MTSLSSTAFSTVVLILGAQFFEFSIRDLSQVILSFSYHTKWQLHPIWIGSKSFLSVFPVSSRDFVYSDTVGSSDFLPLSFRCIASSSSNKISTSSGLSWTRGLSPFGTITVSFASLKLGESCLQIRGYMSLGVVPESINVYNSLLFTHPLAMARHISSSFLSLSALFSLTKL